MSRLSFRWNEGHVFMRVAFAPLLWEVVAGLLFLCQPWQSYMGEIPRMGAYRCFESESKDMLETAPARAVEGLTTRISREPDAGAGSIAAMDAVGKPFSRTDAGLMTQRRQIRWPGGSLD
jgi:hypothetical protein